MNNDWGFGNAVAPKFSCLFVVPILCIQRHSLASLSFGLGARTRRLGSKMAPSMMAYSTVMLPAMFRHDKTGEDVPIVYKYRHRCKYLFSSEA